MGFHQVVLCLQYNPSSLVYLWVNGCFGLYITIHPQLRTAHCRLIRHGCMHWSRLHELPRLSLSTSATTNGLFFLRYLQAPWWSDSIKSLIVELATKPLQPTSTGCTNTFQPHASASAAKFAYHSFFLLNALSMASSHGIFDSTINTHRQDLDHRTRSGLKVGCCEFRLEAESVSPTAFPNLDLRSAGISRETLLWPAAFPPPGWKTFVVDRQFWFPWLWRRWFPSWSLVQRLSTSALGYGARCICLG